MLRKRPIDRLALLEMLSASLHLPSDLGVNLKAFRQASGLFRDFLKAVKRHARGVFRGRIVGGKSLPASRIAAHAGRYGWARLGLMLGRMQFFFKRFVNRFGFI